VVAVVAGAAAAAYLAWPEKKPEAPALPAGDNPEQMAEQAIAYMVSDDFATLDEAQREAYVERVAEQFAERDVRPFFRRGRRADSEKEPSEEERERHRQVMRPLMQKVVEKQMDKYFELPEKEKVVYLDRQIDRMLAGRQQRETRRQEREAAEKNSPKPDSQASSRADRGPRRGRRFTPERLKERIETGDPEDRARRVEYRRALRERMETRGITFGRGRRR